MAEALDFAAAERLLEESEFADCRTLWWSSNYVYLGQMVGPNGEQFATVYKPHSGETPLWDFPDGLYRREVAAYRFSQLLNWPFIPPTVLRDGPKGVGSVQVFVKHDPEAHFFVQRERSELIPQLQRICVFDFLANNADRKGGHCLLDEDGTIWGIDHGLTFHAQSKLRSVIWDWADEPVPDEWLEDVSRAGEALACPGGEAERLRELLDPSEVTATLNRIRRMLTNRKFPVPGPNRHYPWPLV